MLETDPYGVISDALEDARNDALLSDDRRIDRATAIVDRVTQTRAARLSAEALSLPATHFSVLGSLGALLVIAYALTGAASDSPGSFPIETSILFGCLTGTYVLAFNFSDDLNRPFEGVYQVRRSANATAMLNARLLLDPHLPNGLPLIEAAGSTAEEERAEMVAKQMRSRESDPGVVR